MKRLSLLFATIAVVILLSGCPPQKQDICPGFQHCSVLSWSGRASQIYRGATCGTLAPIATVRPNVTIYTFVHGDDFMMSLARFLTILVLAGYTSAQNWQRVQTPTTATSPTSFAVDGANNWYLSDRVSGFWKSTNQGITWAQINTSALASTVGWSIQWDSVTGNLIASIYKPVHFYLSTNGGTTWAQIPEPAGYKNSATPAHACIISAGTRAVTDCGGLFGPAGMTGMYSKNSNFFATALISEGGNSSIYDFFYNKVTGKYLMGTETQGLWQSSDGISFSRISPGSSTIRVGNIKGITYATDGTPLFTAQGGVWKCDQTTNCQNPKNVVSNPNTSAGDAIYRDSASSIYEGHNNDTVNPISVYRSLDQGATWQEWDTGLPAHLDAWQFLENPNDGMLYAVILDDSTNAGWIYRTPIAKAALPPQALTSLAVIVNSNSVSDGPAAFPKAYVQTLLASTPSPGNTINVPAGGDLQAAHYQVGLPLDRPPSQMAFLFALLLPDRR